MSAMSDAEYTSATALSLVNVKVAMMIGMCIPLTRSLPEANWQEGHTMPERRAHEPVPENENTCRVYSHIIGPIHVPAGTESSRARPGGTGETRDGATAHRPSRGIKWKRTLREHGRPFS